MNARVKVPVAAALACAIAFALLLAVAYGLPLGARADTTALNGMIALRGPIATPVATAAAHLADPLPVAAMLAALVAFGWLSARVRQALAGAAFVVAAIVTAEALKVILAHPRLHELVANAHIGAVAFPSGHATAALALALAAVLVAPRGIRATVGAVAAVYAIAVCTSILVLAWHYPSDVFGGMLVASFYFCAAVTALRALAADRPTVAGESRSSPMRLHAGWREALLISVAAAGVAVIARADDLARFASAHPLATMTALAVAAGAAALIAAAAQLEP